MVKTTGCQHELREASVNAVVLNWNDGALLDVSANVSVDRAARNLKDNTRSVS